MSHLKISKTLSLLLTCLLIVQLLSGIFWLAPTKQVRAAGPFTEDFSNTSQISSRQGLNVDTTAGTVTLPQFETSLDNEDTLLFSDLGSDSDITSPTIGSGGTVNGVTYSTGHDDAVTIGDGDTLYFPTSGNLNSNAGSISFWAKVADWNSTVYFFSDSGNSGNLNGYQENETTRIRWKFWIGWTTYQVTSHRPIDSWAANSWHHFVFSWDRNAGVAAATVDGATRISYFNPFNVSLSGNLLVGYRPGGLYAQDTTIDEFRITNKMYGSAAYDTYSTRVLTSTAFDTGVANPVWGNIEWGETKPSKSDIFIQTNVSNDNSTWDGWLTKGMVSFTFDDGFKSQYTNGYPILNQYGFKGTAYVIKNSIGANENYMSLSDLHTLEDAGWEIGGHGETHADLNTLNEAQIRQEFGTGSYDYLINQGFNVRSMATPYGRTVYNPSAKILSDYYEYVRAYGSGALLTYPLYYGKYGVPWEYTSWTGAQSKIDSAATNKEWAVFTQHGVSANDSILAPLAAYVATKNVDVVTFSEGMDRLTYANNSGSQITSANKRYIKYRAIFFSDTGENTPTLSSIKINEPAKIYLGLTNTINADGTYTHNTWPQWLSRRPLPPPIDMESTSLG
ncbi:polysaccharide deacetylase family protein [Patescibacteria group bacterium]|nr:polysaccharide deacetylase family protein [Patescibacteria group bacterium]